jgi:diguanylate cyclase (GGDEF)-like protein
VVTVPPDRNSVAVEFSALDYAATERDRYRYRLDGFDADWIETDAAHRVAAYTNLPPGRYRLLLDVSRLGGAWRRQSAEIGILVLPAWYQTIWFHAVVAVGGILLLFALVQLRTVVLRQRQRELERLVARRTAELSLSRQQLETFAYVDGLTGLPNRRAFDEAFRRLVQTKGERPAAALLLVDLDGFKQVNDTHGHAVGDEVLVIAAGRLRAALRDNDIVARLGGDEFAVLLRSAADQGGCDLVCERIVESIAEEMSVRGMLLHVGVSLGAVRFPPYGGVQDELYRCADKALYEAKNAGRGVWRWHRELAQS